MAAAVFFDVNETTLDLSPLGPHFASVFGDPGVAEVWFPRLLHTSTVCAITGVKSGFRALAGEELRRLAADRGFSLAPEAEEALLGAFAGLPAHPDVAPALDRLREAGVSAFAFSNSSRQLLQAQLASAGLTDRFDGVISVEEVGSFKPDPRVYAHALARVGAATGEAWMLAVHDWDVHGAMKAGLRGALLERSPRAGRESYLEPELRGSSMVDLAEAIVSLR